MRIHLRNCKIVLIQERIARLAAFQEGEHNVLVTTDIASKGIDTQRVCSIYISESNLKICWKNFSFYLNHKILTTSAFDFKSANHYCQILKKLVYCEVAQGLGKYSL